jgi:hypothetical protein
MFSGAGIKKKNDRTYKSPFSPFYFNSSPLLEQLLQAKLRMVTKERPLTSHQPNSHLRVHGETGSKGVFLCGSSKALQVRNIASQQSARERRSLVKLNSRAKTSATIIRCRSES